MGIYDINGNTISSVYDVEGTGIDTAYDIEGNEIFNPAYIVDYSTYTQTSLFTTSMTPIQGFDIYDGIIFQFRANASTISNRMATINLSSGSVINNSITAASDHGDSASFSDEFYTESDDYPLLYVTADTSPAIVYVNRVTKNSSQLIKTFSFPLDKTGYYAALCPDFKNDLAYMIGYSEESATSADGGQNKTVISKWDLSQLTLNQDGSYTPLFVDSYERDFIYVMQGQQFHDGMLWIASGGTGNNGYVYALDPEDGTLLYTVDTESTVEIEGLSFISANEMVVGHQGGIYEKYTFSILNA